MGVIIRSFPPHPNPLPPGERAGHSSPQQSWGDEWHILINQIGKLSEEDMRKVEHPVKVQLGLSFHIENV